MISKLTTSASTRLMPLNKQQSDKSDLISDFLRTTKGKPIIAGTFLRIANSAEVPIITEDMLKQNQFKVSTINENASDKEKTCLDYFYFCMSDEKLIVTLDSRSTINRMETYVNWLLNTKESGTNVSFNPIVGGSAISVADLKKITINNGSSIFVGGKDSTEKNKRASIIDLTKDVLQQLFTDANSLGDLFDENICSAQLVIKFTRPKTMEPEEYKRKTIGAALKSIEDPESVKLQTNGKKLKGHEVLMTEPIEVDDEDGVISEQEVYQKMIQRLM